MNIVDRAIEQIRSQLGHLRDSSRGREYGPAYLEGYATALRDATEAVEHTLRGLSTFEGFGLPDPRTSTHRIWNIPVAWSNPPIFSNARMLGAEPERLGFPMLELARVEHSNDSASWMVRPALWTP